MRRSKLHHSLALCLSLSLCGLTACELEVPTPGDQQEGETLKDKVVETVTGAQQGSGSVELRMVDLSELSARAIPALDISSMQAEITVKAIAVRRCLNGAEETAQPDDSDNAQEPDFAEQDAESTEAGQVEETQHEPEEEASQDEASEPIESGILARRGKKGPPADRSDDKVDGLDLPETLEQELPELDQEAEDIDEPDRPDEDKLDELDEPDKPQPEQDDGDTVATDQELAEQGDAPGACERSQWIVIKQDSLKIDLLNLSNMDAGGLLAKGELPVGTYRGIRLIISEAQVRVGEQEANLMIPSGKASGLKIKAGFEVQEDGQVEIDLGFDLSNSLRKHRKHGWMLRPVLRAKKRRE